MRKVFLLLSIVILCAVLGAQNWQTFTNTTHVYDAYIVDQGMVFYSTWGGVVYSDYFDPNYGLSLVRPAEMGTYTTRDGLVSNDIRCVEYIEESQNLWLGSSSSGINIVSPNGIQVINDTNGLPSNNIRKIVEQNSIIYVATDLGLSVFSYLEGVNFPLLQHQYNYQNTNAGLANNNIHDMLLAANEYLYLSTDFGVSYVHIDSLYQDSAWHNWNRSNSLIDTGYTRHLSANANYIIISQDKKVYRHSIEPNIGNWTTYGTLQGVEDHEISDVCIDLEDIIWISYGDWNENLLSYSLTGDVLVTKIDTQNTVTQWHKNEAGLLSAPISAIMVKNDIIYLCSWGNGIYTKSDEGWDRNQMISIGFPKITEIATDQTNKVWITSGNIGVDYVRKGTMGVSKYDRNLYHFWTNYNQSNSPIITDNVISVAVDSRNRKWFGTWEVVDGSSPEGWMNGLAVYDDTGETESWKRFSRQGTTQWHPETNSWQAVPNSPLLLGNTISEIAVDQNSNMLVACSGDGVTVLNSNDQWVANFQVPTITSQRITYIYHSGDKYFFGSNNDPGIAIWNDSSLPTTTGTHWLTGIPGDLRSCILYGVIDVDTPYEGRQFWLAASSGLFMWDQTNWYKYDTSIKRSIYSGGLWVTETPYYADEERLFGSVRTTPTSIYLDPFNRIWIGSLENGISKYDPQTERFTNYFMPNAPLLSNYITSLGYEPEEGLLLIGTPDGLNTKEIGSQINNTQEFGKVVAYPNPFYPAQHSEVRIINLPTISMPAGTNICRVYDSSGALVSELKQDEFSRFTWNGTNNKGKKCSSGIYFYVVSDQNGNTKRGKIALIR